MDIKIIRRFHCHLCDYITENENKIKRIEKTGRCPSCQNGKTIGWKAVKISKKKKPSLPLVPRPIGPIISESKGIGLPPDWSGGIIREVTPSEGRM